MKKMLFIALASGLVFTSCTKAFNCNCTTSQEGMDDVVRITEDFAGEKSDCEDGSITSYIGDSEVITTCVAE